MKGSDSAERLLSHGKQQLTGEYSHWHKELAEHVAGEQEVREATEWTRWQEADKWSWDEAKRQRWAEGLWRHQQKRRIDRAALRRKLAAAEARQKLEVRAPHA